MYKLIEVCTRVIATMMTAPEGTGMKVMVLSLQQCLISLHFIILMT